MKKIVSLILMLFLVLSITSVYAIKEGVRSQEVLSERLQATASNELRATAKTGIEGLKEFGNERKDKAKEFREQLKIVNTSEERKNLVRLRVQEIKQDFQAARERFIERKEELKQQRANFTDSKQKIKECKNSNVEDCKKARHNAKEFLLTTVDTILELQTQTLSRLESSEDFEGKTEIIAQIELDIQNLISIKENIGLLGDNPSREDIKKISSELRNYWSDNKRHLEFGVERILNKKVFGILTRIKQLETKLDRTLEKLKEKGYDTTKAEEKIGEFKQYLETAKNEHETAVQLLSEIKLSYNKEKLTQAHEHLKKAHQEVIAAHNSLKEAVKEIKLISEGEEILDEEISNDSNETDQETADINTGTSGDTQTNTEI